MVRTRSAAAALAAGGRVRVNGDRVDAASQLVRIGDVVTVALDRVRVLKVTGFADRRGAAVQAAQLFESLQPETPAQAPLRTPPPGERPDRRERRQILRLKRPGNG